jgi:hypothetical protein
MGMIIINDSKAVKQLDFKGYSTMLSWCHENRIKTGSLDSAVYGYNTITHVLKVKHWTVSSTIDEIFYIVRRFDGVKLLIMDKSLINIISDMDKLRNCTISNLVKTFANDCIITDLKLHAKDYEPNIIGIMLWALNIEGWKDIEYAPIIVKTAMTKTEFSNLQSKLKIMGTKYKIMDLNTLAVKNGNKMLIYTRQKNVSET